MFGMGWPELAVIAIVAVFVFGPDRLPDLAKQAGRLVRTARQMMDNARADLSREMGDDFKDLQNLNLRDLNPREVVRRHVMEAMDDDPSPNKPKRPKKPGHRPLPMNDSPPFDPDST